MLLMHAEKGWGGGMNLFASLSKITVSVHAKSP